MLFHSIHWIIENKAFCDLDTVTILPVRHPFHPELPDIVLGRVRFTFILDTKCQNALQLCLYLVPGFLGCKRNVWRHPFEEQMLQFKPKTLVFVFPAASDVGCFCPRQRQWGPKRPLSATSSEAKIAHCLTDANKWNQIDSLAKDHTAEVELT